MTYATLQTIAIIGYMISGGLLAVSVLIFFLMDMRHIIGRLTGSSKRKALARMRGGGTMGKTDETVIDVSLLESLLEKTGQTAGQTTGRLHRRSGRVNKPPQSPPVQPAPAAGPAADQGGTPDYFGPAYPNKTPPSSAPARDAEQRTTVIRQEPEARTTVIQQPDLRRAQAPGDGTMDLAQWQKAQSGEMPAADDDAAEPVKMTILDDIVLLHTEKFIEF